MLLVGIEDGARCVLALLKQLQMLSSKQLNTSHLMIRVADEQDPEFMLEVLGSDFEASEIELLTGLGKVAYRSSYSQYTAAMQALSDTIDAARSRGIAVPLGVVPVRVVP